MPASKGDRKAPAFRVKNVFHGLSGILENSYHCPALMKGGDMTLSPLASA